MDGRSGLGIALSGGGHRAALFAVGALIGVKEALESVKETNAATTVNSIASVSGASLPNGLLAMSGKSFQEMTSSEVMGALEPGVKVFARDGLFFPGKGTNVYVYVSFFFFLVGLWVAALTSFATFLIAIHRGWVVEASTWRTAGVVFGVGFVLVLIIWARKKLPKRFALTCLLGLATVVGGIAVAITFAPTGSESFREQAIVVGVAALIVVLLGYITVRYFGHRSRKVDKVLNERLYGNTTLENTQPHPRHVFCPTNLATGRQAYLSRDFVYGFGLGLGTPNPNLRLSTAVQASACFPGGFLPRRMKASELFANPSEGNDAALTDGGVYDNMGDQWEFGWAARAERIHIPSCFGGPAAHLVVVNSGGFYKPGPLKGHGINLELRSLLRSKDVMYDQTTAVKRRYLVDLFKKATASDLGGVLVHINQTPSTVPDKLANTPASERAQGAQRLLAFLGDQENEPNAEDWESIKESNKTTKTVLKALEPGLATDLMHHGYVLARINIYTVLGIGEVPKPNDKNELDPAEWQPWSRTRFKTYATTGTIS